MDGKQFCPRAVENGGGPNSPFSPPMNGEMEWEHNGETCSYCGSLNPDLFMARLEAGDVKLDPTDKSYKVYVRNDGGAPFNSPTGKFYFQHLSPEQRIRFIELYNDRRIKIDGGGFYVLPFFCRPTGAPLAAG